MKPEADVRPGDFDAGHRDVGHVGDHLEGVRDLFGTDHCVQKHAVDLALVPPGVHGAAGEHVYEGEGHGQAAVGVHATAGDGHRDAGEFVGRKALKRGSPIPNWG